MVAVLNSAQFGFRHAWSCRIRHGRIRHGRIRHGRRRWCICWVFLVVL